MSEDLKLYQRLLLIVIFIGAIFTLGCHKKKDIPNPEEPIRFENKVNPEGTFDIIKPEALSRTQNRDVIKTTEVLRKELMERIKREQSDKDSRSKNHDDCFDCINDKMIYTHFDFDKRKIAEAAREDLFKNYKRILKLDGRYTAIVIEGHCDDRGTSSYNIALGDARAQKIKRYYVALGLPEQRIYAISYGEEIPFCTEATEECWRMNRRGRTIVQE